jgi:hypothetical protein
MRTGERLSLIHTSTWMIFAAIALSACGQIVGTGTTATPVQAVDTSGYSSVTYTSPTTTTTTGGSTVVSGASSSSEPKFDTALQNGGQQVLALGSSVTLTAPFVADASLTYQWYKNGIALNGAAGTSSQLTFNSLSSTDYAVYQVKATNSQGSIVSQPFTINPVLMLATLGSHDCNGAQCNNDPGTAQKVCQQRFGEQSVMASAYGFGPSGVKWTTQFCAWTGSGWNCNMNCTWTCNGNNVLGYVYCLD